MLADSLVILGAVLGLLAVDAYILSLILSDAVETVSKLVPAARKGGRS